MDLGKIRTIHLIAVCGTGMGALAGILKNAGYRVTGSDQNVYPPMSEQLTELGIPLQQGYAADNLHHNPDLVIIGNAVRKDNPEARAVLERKTPYLSFPAALRKFFLDRRRTIALCGTHGKTTTTALVAYLFTHAQRDPSFLIGGVAQNFGVGFRLGNGDDFILEGDEYDTAFFDKVPKFIRYKPDWSVVANIEFDHADIYDNLDQILRGFEQLVVGMPCDGKVFAGVDCPNAMKVVHQSSAEVLTFGIDLSADYHPGSWWVSNGRMEGEIVEQGKTVAQFDSLLVGEHNLKNILGAAAVARQAGISWNDIASGIQTFRGIRRRQEVRGTEANVTVIDDFAHHPTAVAATLKSLRAQYEGQRLLAVFEPRTNTSRRNFFQQHYAEAFDDAHAVFLAPVHDPDAIDPEQRFDPDRLALDLVSRGIEAKAFENLDTLFGSVVDFARSNDVMVLMSNGGFGGLHARILEALKSKG